MDYFDTSDSWEKGLTDLVDMLLNSLHCHVLSKEHFMIALASTLTWNILFEIYSSMEHWETDL
jgi:hypothetical protein